MEKSGKKVIIYTDPITQTDNEGIAKLLRFDKSMRAIPGTGKLERWEVVFIRDGFICDRLILRRENGSLAGDLSEN